MDERQLDAEVAQVQLEAEQLTGVAAVEARRAHRNRTLLTWPPRNRPNPAASNVQAGLHLTDQSAWSAKSTRSLGGPGYIIKAGRIMVAVTWGEWSA